MRALIFSNYPLCQVTIPQLADEQIVVGPDWPDSQDMEGRWISLRAPSGLRELEVVLSKIPPYQWPDRIVMLHQGQLDSGEALQAMDIEVEVCA